MPILDSLISALETPQKVHLPTIYSSNELHETKSDSSLAEISEIVRQILIPLDLLKRYHLISISGNSRISLINCLKSINDNKIKDIREWTRATGLNVIVWSSASHIENTRVDFYSATEPVEIDRLCLIIYQNKYGQYFPVSALGNNAVPLYYPGVENPAIHSSYLLLRLINFYFNNELFAKKFDQKADS